MILLPLSIIAPTYFGRRYSPNSGGSQFYRSV